MKKRFSQKKIAEMTKKIEIYIKNYISENNLEEYIHYQKENEDAKREKGKQVVGEPSEVHK